MALKGLGAATALPIGAAEFSELWSRVFKSWRLTRAPRKIALAVSGGSDSMALAYLCRQLVSEGFVPELEAKAFIVDHKARRESTEEARRVAGWMKDLGLQPEILTLNWNSNPSIPQGFETAARTLRYRALGEACISHGTRTLFLGHHNDDNIETALLRLSEGHTRFGLGGFEEVSDIPENVGRYGIWKSGIRMSFRSIYQHDSPIVAESLKAPTRETAMPYQLDQQQPFIATGGVHLCRPFRTISKSRLLATCHAGGVPSVTDETNSDPTVTGRNAVRYLLASGDLPRALQPRSLSHLIQTSRQAKSDDNLLSDSFIRLCKIFSCELRSGCVVVQFPSAEELHSIRLSAKAGASGRVTSQLGAQALTIRRFNDIVCGRQSTDGDTFVSATSAVFPQRGNGHIAESEAAPRKSFTLGSVLWTPVRQLSGRDTDNPPNNPSPGYFAPKNHAPNSESPEPNIWLLSRRLQPKKFARPTVDFELRIPEFCPSDTNVTSKWTGWNLWDDRYWVSIRAIRVTKEEKDISTGVSTSPRKNETLSATSVPITMRPVEESDMVFISQQMERQDIQIYIPREAGATSSPHIMGHNQFKRLLHRTAPGNIRYTMPILSAPDSTLPSHNQVSKQTAEGREIYGFPSMQASTSRRICVHHPTPSRTPNKGSPDQPTHTECQEQENGVMRASQQHQQHQQHQGPVSYWRLEWRIEFKQIDIDMFRLTGYKAPRNASFQEKTLNYREVEDSS